MNKSSTSLKNSFDALSKEDNAFEFNNDNETVTGELASSILDSDSEEVEEVFVKKDLSIEPMDGVFDDARKKMEAPSKKTPRKTGIWSGRKADSHKGNIAFSPETKVHYFDREDIEEVEHENCFMNTLPEKWLSLSYGLRNANHTQTLDLADFFGRFVYEENLISRRFPETNKALITTPLDSLISTAFFSNNVVQGFQENFDDEADERSNKEYHRDLELEFHKRALLANSKHFIKKKEQFFKSKMSNSSLVSKGFQPKFTPKLIQSSQHTQSSQNEPKFQKDYKAEYKKMKAKLALLEASPSTSQSSKPFKSKNKGLVFEMFD
ncbi:hypothetical protein Tco_0313083 [Tanacetum coccineum]